MRWSDVRPGDMIKWDTCIDLIIGVSSKYENYVKLTLFIMSQLRDDVKSITTIAVNVNKRLIDDGASRCNDVPAGGRINHDGGWSNEG